jgi:outer membrane biosynthesis protein TonB
VFRRIGPVIGTVAAVAFVMFPTMALAQVNIDQGKSAADIFSSVCTACHKTSRGLASGKNSLMLSAFLREHYTASSDQASALAAYVLGAGGSEPAPKQKPEVEHARAEEPQTGEPKAGEPKTAIHPIRAAAKPEEEKRPKQQAKREEHLASPPGPEKPEAAPETASREVTPKPDDAAREALPVSAAPTPAPVANASPSAAEPPNSAPKSAVTPTASAAVPAEEQHSAGAAVPRDNIPD